MSRLFRLALIAVVLPAVSLTAGCANPATDGGAPESPPSATATAPPEEPTSIPSDDAELAELAELVLSPNGLGPLEIGRTVGEVDGEGNFQWDPDRCGTGDEYAGRWVSTDPQWATDETSQPGGVGIWTEDQGRDAAVIEIGVGADTVATKEGITVGSTADEVRAAYPDARIEVSPVSTFYIVDGDQSALTIEVAAADAAGGVADTVVYLRVAPSSSEPFSAIRNDTGQTGCPS